MKKLLIILFLLCLPVQAETLQGGIIEKVYVEQAREAALDNLPRSQPLQGYAQLDSDYQTNYTAGINKFKLPDRKILFFSTGQYNVAFFGNTYSLAYNKHGRLIGMETYNFPVTQDPVPVPGARAAAYRLPYGKLDFVSYLDDFGIQYDFKSNGALFRYCINQRCYNQKGRLLYSMKSQNF